MHTPECQHSSSFVCSAVGSSLVRERAAGRVFPGKTESACLLFNSCVPSSQKVAAILEQSPLISYPVKWPRVEGTHEVPARGSSWVLWDRHSSALWDRQTRSGEMVSQQRSLDVF